MTSFDVRVKAFRNLELVSFPKERKIYVLYLSIESEQRGHEEVFHEKLTYQEVK